MSEANQQCNMENSTPAQRLLAARKAINLSQRAFAKAIRTHHSTISCWERGKNEPSLSDIVAIEDCFQINKEWLMTGKGEIQPIKPSQSQPRATPH